MSLIWSGPPSVLILRVTLTSWLFWMSLIILSKGKAACSSRQKASSSSVICSWGQTQRCSSRTFSLFCCSQRSTEPSVVDHCYVERPGTSCVQLQGWRVTTFLQGSLRTCCVHVGALTLLTGDLFISVSCFRQFSFLYSQILWDERFQVIFLFSEKWSNIKILQVL